MNLILFEASFDSIRLDGLDWRAAHIRKVLRAQVGTKVFLGFVNGPRARAQVTELGEDGSVRLEVIGTEPAPEALPITLILGLPRPHTAKRILTEAASMGIQAIHFFEAEQGEPSYAQSSLWHTDEWKERLKRGIEQSFGTYHPDVAMHPDLQTALTTHFEVPARIALDNYEAAGPLNKAIPKGAASAALALGPERGWSANERDALRRNGWTLAHLGPHVLRLETAVIAAISVVAAGIGSWQRPTRTSL